jgi:hypothetical protein
MAMADRFLKLLDPNAERFTFTLFHDRKCGPPITLHDGIRDVWPCITAENSLGRGYGAFVTVNQTDFTGRKAENIIRARALFRAYPVNAHTHYIQRFRGAVLSA